MKTNYTFLFCLLFTVTIVGCDSTFNEPNKEKPKQAQQETVKIDSPYSVWITDKQLTAYELSSGLTQDITYADKLCKADKNQPKNYSTHFALISTDQYDRVDLIDKYHLDKNKAVLFGDTERLLASNLGLFVAQTGAINTKNKQANKAGSQALKLTLSKDGKFTGYCESSTGYTYVVNTDSSKGDLDNYSMSCSQPATLVCLSVR